MVACNVDARRDDESMKGLLRIIAVGSMLVVGCAVDDAQQPTATCATQACGDHTSRAVLFGGQTGLDTWLNDTWTWNGTSWKQETAPGPSARSSAQATTLNRLMVLYGGFDGNLDDTWTWNGRSWTEGASGLYPIYGGGMSPLNGAAMLYGGDDDWGLSDWETWLWDGASWTQENTDVIGAPQNVYGFGVATLNDTVVLFGGMDGAGNAVDWTWTWNGGKWTWLDVAGPSARYYASMTTVNGVVVLFGGRNGYDDMSDTWIWDGASWTEANVGGPSARDSYGMTTLDDTIVLFGGETAGGDSLSDTWIWDGGAGATPTSRVRAHATRPSWRRSSRRT